MTTEPETPENTEEEKSGRRKLSDADYAEACNLYELGQAGIAELSDKYGCTRQNLYNRFKADGIKKSSRVHELQTAATEAAKKAAEVAAAAANRFSAKRAELIEETRIQGLNLFKQSRLLAHKVVTDALKSAHSLASVDDDLKALQRYNKILTENITTSLQVLNADEHVDESDMPLLRIEDLTEEDILQHHKNTGALEHDATVDDLNLPDLSEVTRTI